MKIAVSEDNLGKIILKKKLLLFTDIFLRGQINLNNPNDPPHKTTMKKKVKKEREYERAEIL